MTYGRNGEFDGHMMGIALAMARFGLGQAWPNPSVGAVIADEKTGEIIARGVTQIGGRPHGETVALEMAGVRADGKTLYVTLEPCSHVGATPPCTDAIINANIARVVIGVTDPDPRVSGRGINKLAAAGIDITTGVRAEEAFDIARGHILRATERRPFVQVKMALDSQGQIPLGDGSGPTWVTGKIARAHGHMLRATTDAILIGAGTLRDDRPELTCRLPGMRDRSPVRVIVGQSLTLRDVRTIIKSPGGAPLWVARARSHRTYERPTDVDRLSDREIPVPLVAQHLWLPSLTESLVEHGITRLLVEGGPTLWRAFAKAARVDEVIVFAQNPNKGIPDQSALHSRIADLLPGLHLKLNEARTLDVDTMYKFAAT